MLEVGGANGPLLVYRPWPKNTLIEMARQYLPDLAQGGAAIGFSLMNMVAVVRPTITELSHLRRRLWHRLREQCGGGTI